MSHFRYLNDEEEYWPGPLWEPFVYDGSFPQLAEPGDIYINRYRDPPLYYVFTRKGNCELVGRDEIKEWVTGGLMKLPREEKTTPSSTRSPDSGGTIPAVTPSVTSVPPWAVSGA